MRGQIGAKVPWEIGIDVSPDNQGKVGEEEQSLLEGGHDSV